ENNRLSAIDIPNAGRVTYNTYHWNRPAKITLPGGSQIDLAYDPLMRLLSKAVKDPAQQFLMDYEYEHSPANNITKKTTEQGEYAYQYDELSRLTQATNPVLEDENYTYDLLANRLSASGVEGSYDANNALLTYGETAFEYDANGNLIKKTVGSQVTHYEYNVEGRLIRVTDGENNLIAEYDYDPFGRRIWKEVEGVRTYFVYAAEGLIGEYDENGVEIKGYGYRPNSMWTTNPLFQKTNGSYYWYQNDHIGTPQKLIDSQGNVLWAAVYEAFGKAKVDVALVSNHLRFPGQYFDEETSLHYNFFRDYDPKLGRYIKSDPIGLGGGINTYVYASNNPVFFIDFLGLAYSPIGEHGYNCRPSIAPWTEEWCDKLKNFIKKQREMLKLYQEVAKGNQEAISSLQNDVEKLADPSMKGCFVNPKITEVPGGTEICVVHECEHIMQFVDVVRELMKGGNIKEPAWQKKVALWEIEAYKVGIEQGENAYNAHCGGCQPGERWK
ncbi:MAG: RHS repeat-associated core domain-containing protein, partial [Candidatus Parabeggiatoa sp.]|nr:RHS repeat-associated core domain-containing protein [Candidatus Parabeggiatoa sp.]